MLFKMELSVIAMIGIVMLVGIVKKNAIMMIDFAIERRRVGFSAEAAIREAALLRFRPIMMTTFAAIFGALPIALGTGAGAELRQPLGIAVVGGLLPVAAPDALHHPGHLHLSRPNRPHAQIPARAATQRGCGASRATDCHRGRVESRQYGTVRRPKRTVRPLRRVRQGGGNQIEKLVPQPQDAVACGLLTRNDAPIKSSTKSISEPTR